MNRLSLLRNLGFSQGFTAACRPAPSTSQARVHWLTAMADHVLGTSALMSKERIVLHILRFASLLDSRSQLPFVRD